MKKQILKNIILSAFLAFFLFFPFIKPTLADTKNKEINFFGSPTCPHCIKERQFLDELKKNRSDIVINEYVFSENTELVNNLYKEYNVTKNQQGLVPVTFNPIERAVPATILIAESNVKQFKSPILSSAIVYFLFQQF